LKRAITGGGVVVAFGVTGECQRTIGSVEVACGVGMQRRNASSRISTPGRVIKKGNSANRRVVVADHILRERGNTTAVLLLPAVFAVRAPAPVAVFELPLMLLKSARLPVAVLKLPKKTPVGLLEFTRPPTLLKRANAPISRVCGSGQVA
jgi:hypothetical protein